MKKAFTFVVAIAMTLALTASAKTGPLLFNRPQFQHHEYNCTMDYAKLLLTVPMVYKGTLNLTEDKLTDNGQETWERCDEADIANCKTAPKNFETHCCYIVDTNKNTVPIFMTICQPCIDCFPCTSLPKGDGTDKTPVAFPGDLYSCQATPGWITKWNLYYVDVDKKNKTTDVYKVNLLDYEVEFFTGKAKKAEAFMFIADYGDLFLAGKKSDYTFKFQTGYLNDGLDWEQPANAKEAKKKYTAYIKSLNSISGSASISGGDVELNKNCDESWEHNVSVNKNVSFKLTRDASLTKKAITSCFTAELPAKVKNWEDCFDPIPASYCEEYFLADEEDVFDAYLNGKYNKKGVDYDLLIGDDYLLNDMASSESVE